MIYSQRRKKEIRRIREYVKIFLFMRLQIFPNHPFKVKMDDKMLETIESVRDHGVLVPALVREKPVGGYEMISWTSKKNGKVNLAGKETMPCIVEILAMMKPWWSWLTAIYNEKKSYHLKSICLQDEVGRYEKTGTENRFNFVAIGYKVERKTL